MASHQKVINEQLGEARGQLNKMVAEIGTTLDQVDTREKVINGQFDNLVNEFKLVKENLQDTMDKYNLSSEKVNSCTNDLQNLVDDLEKIKHQMEQQGTSMTDTGPLVKLKNSMTKIRDEIAQFDIRIGVIENILLQSKIRSKKHHGTSFGHL
jgi:estrogen-related receptor beta like 1